MREDLQAAFEEMGKFSLGLRKPPGLEVIEPLLKDDEKVVALARGTKNKSAFCTLVLTDHQLYMFSFTGMKSFFSNEVVPFDLITGVELKKTMTEGLKLIITRAGNIDEIASLDTPTAPAFLSKLQASMSRKPSATPTTIIQNQAIDPIDQIKKLKDLLDLGIINDQEFEEKKNNLLGQI